MIQRTSEVEITIPPPPEPRYIENSPSFRCLIQNAVEKHGGDRSDAPRVPKSTIYHWLNKKLVFWKNFGEDIRRELSHRLQLEGWNKSAAGEKAWRMFEEAIYVSEDNRGRLDTWQLIAEIEGLWAYADARQYPADPSEEDVEAALAEIRRVFNDAGLKRHLPTTTMHHFKKLGMWSAALACWMAEEREALIDGDSPEMARMKAWRELHSAFDTPKTIEEIFEFLLWPTKRFDIGVLTDSVTFHRVGEVSGRRQERPEDANAVEPVDELDSAED